VRLRHPERRAGDHVGRLGDVGSGYAALNVDGSTFLATIDLTTGVATVVGSIGDGQTSLMGLTIGQTALE
jgi:hypothetical protein